MLVTDFVKMRPGNQAGGKLGTSNIKMEEALLRLGVISNIMFCFNLFANLKVLKVLKINHNVMFTLLS